MVKDKDIVISSSEITVKLTELKQARELDTFICGVSGYDESIELLLDITTGEIKYKFCASERVFSINLNEIAEKAIAKLNIE